MAKLISKYPISTTEYNISLTQNEYDIIYSLLAEASFDDVNEALKENGYSLVVDKKNCISLNLFMFLLDNK